MILLGDADPHRVPSLQVSELYGQHAGVNGVEATRIVKQGAPETKVLFMAVHASHIDDALDAGADAFMMKDATRQELLLNIRRLARARHTPQ